MTSAAEDELLDGPVVVTSKIDFGDAAAVLEKLRLELARIGDRNGRRGAERLLDGPVVLAGLHACGDLSASMLRWAFASHRFSFDTLLPCKSHVALSSTTRTLQMSYRPVHVK